MASVQGSERSLRASRSRQDGFSLMELLLAAALGALLITATATMTGSFGQTLAQLDTDSVDSYEAALARISRDVRYAWWVDVPSADSVRIADSDNDITEYFRVGNSLLVRRPNGEQGSVITGLSAAVFQQEATQRLRTGPNRSTNGRLSGVAAPSSISGAIELVPGNSLAFGFTVNSNAGPLDVSGVDERMLSMLPDRLDLRLAKGSVGGLLHVELYTARAPGDARPRPGATALAAFDVGLRLLPAGVVIIPPTNPLDMSTAAFAAPLTTTSVAITTMTGRLLPGTAYCVVLSVTGTGSLGLVGAWSGATQRGVIFRHTAANAWTDLPAVIPYGVFGNGALTGTVASSVASQVHIALSTSTGAEHLGSACVSSQVLAEDPWLGVVPDEQPTLP